MAHQLPEVPQPSQREIVTTQNDHHVRQGVALAPRGNHSMADATKPEQPAGESCTIMHWVDRTVRPHSCFSCLSWHSTSMSERAKTVEGEKESCWFIAEAAAISAERERRRRRQCEQSELALFAPVGLGPHGAAHERPGPRESCFRFFSPAGGRAENEPRCHSAPNTAAKNAVVSPL